MTRPPSAYRLLVKGGGISSVHELPEGETVIGRIAPADVVLADSQVSSRHAIVTLVDGRVEIRDLGSTNGTFANGRPLKTSGLEHGSAVTIGPFTLTLDDTRIGAAKPTPPPALAAPAPAANHSGLIAAAAVFVALAAVAWVVFTRTPAESAGSPTTPTMDAAAFRARLEKIVKSDRPGYRAETLDYIAALEKSVAGTPLAEEARIERERLARLPEISVPVETTTVSPPTPTAKPRSRADEYAVRFDMALQNGRWLDASNALQEMGRADEAKARLDKALETAVDGLIVEYPDMVRRWGDEKAYEWLKAHAGEFPATSVAAGKLQLKLLELKEPAAAKTATPAPSKTEKRPAPGANDERPAAPADLLVAIDEADAALKSGDIPTAVELLRPLESRTHAAKRPDLVEKVARLTRRSEAEQRARELVRRAAGDPASAPKDIPHLPGEKGALVAADAEGVRLGGPKGAVTLRWQALPAHTWASLSRVAVEVDDGIDMSVVLLRVGKESEAHTLLAKASKKQPARMARIQEVLADARDIPVDGNTFTLVGERWVSAKEYARIALNEGLKKDADLLVKGKPEERRAAFDKLRDLGDDARGTLVRALILRIATCTEELQKDGAWKPLVGLKAARVELDRLRQDAFTLIDDEKEYPYPYQPPEAPPEAYAKYLTSQKLIDERVALVKKQWEKKDSVRLSPEWKRKVQDLMEARAWAQEVQAMQLSDEEPFVMWPPADGVVTIRTIALSADDRSRLQGSIDAVAWSEANPGRSTKGEQDEFKLTNDYRLMMGRHAVRMHDRLTAAARGHCEDMARLGFFAHESPVEGKRTPGQRIRAAGVRPIGTSENIARAGGPAGAHNGWTHSSGHHRNLLSAEWRYLGVGNSGSFWCQNFIISEAKTGEPDDG